MSSYTIISLTIAKLLAGFGGTSLPGLVALKLNPALINQIVKKNQLQSIIVTGTNGKTTTAYLLSKILSLAGISCFRNASGSNLLRGIATTLINQSNIFGIVKSKMAVWEVDEAVFPKAVRVINPSVVIITNLSRDQLDRYGEVDHLLKLWQASLNEMPRESRILINAADQRLRRLKHKNLSYFGKSIPGLGLKYPSRFHGKFNQDSLWAAAAVCRHLKLNPELVKTAAVKSPAAFGRGERFSYRGTTYQINLVKNPASFKAVWQMFLDRRCLNCPLLLLLNDRLADGNDVSWIYDVPFSQLKSRRRPIVVGGSRAHDLALRLKYAGLNPNLIQVKPKISQALNDLKNFPGPIKYIFPTYTAMLKTRQYLNRPAWN